MPSYTITDVMKPRTRLRSLTARGKRETHLDPQFSKMERELTCIVFLPQKAWQTLRGSRAFQARNYLKKNKNPWDLTKEDLEWSDRQCPPTTFLNSKCNRELIYSTLEKWQGFKIEFNSAKAILWEGCNDSGPNMQPWFRARTWIPEEKGSSTAVTRVTALELQWAWGPTVCLALAKHCMGLEWSRILILTG